ncbi:hypothetical protein DNU06_04005 [Putridiphycobacter roseus]|uniref:Sulfatase-modifying factor enzyme-like domain-containing protein n=1 Tax=Putridiphycobacter roseus TaxID=2219161 RepID=A0A2W1N411_9FLAO|nr:SUMF1/EgtB/PvdO family nonheme iron enzyme [Putridiphycobacter roseus]PZE17791.1 hypothetical protein DNU06_04005 [Putridiphycobacter roseus]
MHTSKYFFVTFIFSLLFISTTLKNKQKNNPPPGTLQISNNLFIDKTEITNFSWLEFMHWTQKIFGKNAQEYHFILPDTTVWLDLDSIYHNYTSTYLRSPKYRNYPVVGVTYLQALSYSLWRSDRVMEFTLIKNKIIKPNKSTAADSTFSITKYFNGNYLGMTPDPRFMSYPKYSLPTPQQYKIIQEKSDSINQKNLALCKPKTIKKAPSLNCLCPLHQMAISESEMEKNETFVRNSNGDLCKDFFIAHLKSNVSELTFIHGILYGYNFEKSCENRSNLLWRSSQLKSATIGFRNVCSYQTWHTKQP